MQRSSQQHGGDDSGTEEAGLDTPANEDQVNQLHQAIEEVGDADSDVVQRISKAVLGDKGRCRNCFDSDGDVSLSNKFLSQQFPGFVS